MVVAEWVTPSLGIDLAPNHPSHLHLPNPVMIASGTFGVDGFGGGLREDLELSLLGAVIPKTVTLDFRPGNLPPQKSPTEFDSKSFAAEPRFLNAFGLNNLGIESILRYEVPKWAASDARFILSMSGIDISEFEKMARLTRGVYGFSAIELNLSCPNVEKQELFAHSKTDTSRAVQAVKKHAEVPVIAKLAPNVPDIGPIAAAAEEAGADAITICNTMPAMRFDMEAFLPLLGNETGGLSGPSLHPIAVALVYRAAKAVKIPIIGVGGIFSAEDAIEFLLAGASAVQIGTANLINPAAPFEILKGIQSFMVKRGISDIKDLIKAGHKETG